MISVVTAPAGNVCVLYVLLGKSVRNQHWTAFLSCFPLLTVVPWIGLSQSECLLCSPFLELKCPEGQAVIQQGQAAPAAHPVNQIHKSHNTSTAMSTAMCKLSGLCIASLEAFNLLCQLGHTTGSCCRFQDRFWSVCWQQTAL